MPGHENDRAHRPGLERPLSFVDGLAQDSAKANGREPADASREHQADAAAPTADGPLSKKEFTCGPKVCEVSPGSDLLKRLLNRGPV